MLEKLSNRVDIILTIVNGWCIVIDAKEGFYDFVQTIVENSYRKGCK